MSNDVARRSGRCILVAGLLAAALASTALARTPCAPAPRLDCGRPERSELRAQSDAGGGRRLLWKWRDGEAAPPSGDAFAVCLYAGAQPALVLDAAVPSGAPSWRRGGGTSGVSVAAARLPGLDPANRSALPLTIQLVGAASGPCWEAVYAAGDESKAGPRGFRVRQRGVPRPNVILITTDDQRWDTVSFMPAVMAEIAAKGVSFENAFSANPVCLPARASILTGNHSHTHGVRGNGRPEGGPLRLRGPDRQTIAVWLQAQGYRTGFFGKYHGYGVYCAQSSCPVPPGWDEWHAFLGDDYYNYQRAANGSIVTHFDTAGDYSTDVIRDRALDFLEAHPREPVFVHFTPVAPHASAGHAFFPIPAPRHAGALAGISPWRPQSYLEDDVGDKPAWIRGLPGELPPRRQAFEDAARRMGLESLLAVDEAIAALLAKLAAQGRLTDTIVVFTSDHGYSAREHRHYGKLCPYEECIRVPLLVRYPRRLRDRSAVRPELASLIDLAPTLAEWAGVPAAALPPLDGRSLAGLAEGVHDGGWRDAILLEQWQERRYAGVRTTTWKYIIHENGERELYDLVADPHELTSVAAARPEVVADLEPRIAALGGAIP